MKIPLIVPFIALLSAVAWTHSAEDARFQLSTYPFRGIDFLCGERGKMDVSPAKKRGMESPEAAESLTLSRGDSFSLGAGGLQLDDRFPPSSTTVVRRHSGEIKEEDVNMTADDKGVQNPMPGGDNHPDSAIYEQLRMVIELQTSNQMDIASLSKRQLNTEQTANTLVMELQSVLTHLRSQQSLLSQEEELVKQRLARQQQDLQHSSQMSLDRDRVLEEATQQAINETRAQVQHLTESQAVGFPDTPMLGQDDRGLRSNRRFAIPISVHSPTWPSYV